MSVSLEKQLVELQSTTYPVESLDAVVAPDVYLTPSQYAVARNEVGALGHAAIHKVVTAETKLNKGEMPTGDDLTQYLERFVSSSVPKNIELASEDDKGVFDIYSHHEADIDVTNLETVRSAQDKYTERMVRKLREGAWWSDTSDRIELPVGQSFNLKAKHEIQFAVEDKVLEDQKLEIFEVGHDSVASDDLAIVIDVLKLVDQHSGSLLTLDEYRKPVVLLNETDASIKSSKYSIEGTEFEGKTPLGLHTLRATIIDMNQIKQRAREYGLDMKKLLATTVIHEVLGHQLDFAMSPKPGVTFDEYFDYSEKKTVGENFKVHDHIEPKDKTVHSAPVMEYGKVDAAEDFATSAHAAMVRVVPEDRLSIGTVYEINADRYREDIVAEVMDRAAQRAADDKGHKRFGVPGFVGSEVTYNNGPDGALRTEPVRKLRINTVDGKTAAHDEFAKLTQSYVPEPVIKVRKMELVF